MCASVLRLCVGVAVGLVSGSVFVSTVIGKLMVGRSSGRKLFFYTEALCCGLGIITSLFGIV